MLKIILTGPESTGKTTLCKQLSQHFQIPFVSEYALSYINNLGRRYTKKDILRIAKGQFTSEQKNKKLLFCDTDLITLKIWSCFKYNTCDSWILQKIEKQKIENRFYLLCKPDIPWKAHPQRENPNERQKLFELYKKEIENIGHKYIVVEKNKRLQTSIAKLSKYIINFTKSCKGVPEG